MSAERCSRDLLQKCEGMAMVLLSVPVNFEGKGLHLLYGWLEGRETRSNSGNAGSPSRILGVAYNRRVRDQGLICNYCPWCGADIRRADASESLARLG